MYYNKRILIEAIRIEGVLTMPRLMVLSSKNAKCPIRRGKPPGGEGADTGLHGCPDEV